MNNLEWLMEHDTDAARDALRCFVDGETIGCSECAYDKHRVDGVCMNSSEWLLAEHVDMDSGECVHKCPNDEPPESDAIEHARWRWKYRPEDGDEVVMSEYNCNLLMSDLDAIADMVERDYVSRMDYEDAAELCGKYADTIDMLTSRCTKLEAERDELARKLEIADRHEFESDQACDECKEHIDELLAKLIAERGEWKSKAEQAERAMNVAAGKWARADARSAERAAAVERLKNDTRARFSPDAIVCALLDGRRGKIDWSLECDAILDLLTDDDANDDLAPFSNVSADDVDANDGNATQDSREKLEADARALQTRIWKAGANSDGISLSHIIELLDRQAAITERETEKKWSCFSDSAGGHITELTNQLESAHAKNRALKAHIAKMQEGRHGWHIKGKELQQQVDSLKRKLEAATDANSDYRDEWHRVCAERANLARDLGNAMAERDRYRELCGKLLDAADEMHRVRDAYDQFGKVGR